MVGEIFAGIGAFNSMFSIAKGIRDLDDAVKRNAAVSQLWEQIIAAQQRYTEAVEEVDNLKEELRRFETWEAEKQRYKLDELRKGVFAYSLKDGMESDEPSHYLCASCYQNGFKSILKQETWSPGRCNVYVCHDCGWYAYLSGMADPDHNKLRPTPHRVHR